jgi:hypothetical protein
MLDILGITGPIYITILFGYLATRKGLFARADMQVFGKFVINLALPAMLFNALAQRRLGEIINLSYMLAYAVGSLAVIGLALWWPVGGRPVQDRQCLLCHGHELCNSGFRGLPHFVAGPLRRGGCRAGFEHGCGEHAGDPAIAGAGRPCPWRHRAAAPNGLAVAQAPGGQPDDHGPCRWVFGVDAGVDPTWPGHPHHQPVCQRQRGASLFVIGGTLVGLPAHAWHGK